MQAIVSFLIFSFKNTSACTCIFYKYKRKNLQFFISACTYNTSLFIKITKNKFGLFWVNQGTIIVHIIIGLASAPQISPFSLFPFFLFSFFRVRPHISYHIYHGDALVNIEIDINNSRRLEIAVCTNIYMYTMYNNV